MLNFRFYLSQGAVDRPGTGTRDSTSVGDWNRNRRSVWPKERKETGRTLAHKGRGEGPYDRDRKEQHDQTQVHSGGISTGRSGVVYEKPPQT